MKHLWKKELLVIIFLVTIMIVGSFVSAKTIKPEECGQGGDTYCNPLGTTVEITTLTTNILNYLIQLTVPLAGLSIIIAGLFYVYAVVSGNASKSTQAKKIFYYVLIGSVCVVGATAISSAVIEFLKNPA